ncbi:PAS domain-containing sensor histidine kinase [Clostridium gasigenes]|uniref:sensor histidine kinase n=1 Tax=Clostridium gasigenes TaxID=94869 RepID=UPI001C0E32E3|nr:PAS domain-containing sensor histidine kinase [Clostridium gasigenes]MBU3134715.1 PAS domain-containing sensor histidine kinase [Clostridium gasigenes]
MEWLNTHVIYVTIILINIIIILYLLIDRKTIDDQKEILKTIINSSPDIIGYKDSKGKWVEVNKTLEDIINAKEPIIGKTDLDLMKLIPDKEDEFRVCYETDKKIWENGNIKIVEEIFKLRDGTYQTFDVIKVPLYNIDGSRKGIGVIGRDITYKKKSEENKRILNELQHYNEIRTEFFANLSHELRTPLTLIVSALKLVEISNNDYNELSKNKINKYIKTIRQNSFRLIRLINNLIDITKSEDGYLELQVCNHNIVSIVEDITLSIKDFAEEKEISLIFDTNIEEKYTLCDNDKIERIILNLMSNAIKFTPKGGEIKVEIVGKNNGIQISVTDTGIGIPLENQKDVFERFVQVDKSLSRSNEGSGIGLSLVKSFVEMHNGKIIIDSSYIEGTRFVIDLPCNIICEEVEKKCFKSEDSRIQIINIEFSDVYS